MHKFKQDYSWAQLSVMPVSMVLLILFATAILLADEPIDFASHVAPILRQHCLTCHKPGNAKGELSLATIADLAANEFVLPGQPDNSYLIELVTPSGGEKPEMPKEGEPLSERQVAVLTRWISEGAKWPEGLVVREASQADKSWWSLQPLADVRPPGLSEVPAAWSKNPVDRFVYAKLREQGLLPASPSDRRTLIRRATYDLTGLPPSPAEVDGFVADASADAYERLIDRLLASPHYGERWGRHWLDVVRFGESRGFERNEIINNAWPFRDYVIHSFNEDKPFDQLAREHLAGDIVGKDDPAVEVGTTFLVCGPYDDVGNQDPRQAAQIRANTIDEIIRGTTETFLGLTVGCARCHDHKFDPILQEDYYALYSTFAGVQHDSRVIATAAARKVRVTKLSPLTQTRDTLAKRIEQLEEAVLSRAEDKSAELESQYTREPVRRTGTEETFPTREARYVRLIVDAAEADPHSRGGYRIDEFEVWTAEPEPRNVALAANGGQATGVSRVADDFADAYSARLTIDGRFGARWIAAGPELTIQLRRPEIINRILFSSDRTGDAGQHEIANFVSDYRIEISLDGKNWRQVADSQSRHPVHARHRRKRLIDWAITNEERAQLVELRSELDRIDRVIAAVPTLPQWWAGDFQDATGPFHVFLGGDPQRPGPDVTPASLSAFDDNASAYALPSDAVEAQRRQALADWIVHRNNPLTPRVLANRLWQHHFGKGIVATPSDFGYMGGRPTHPQLLDWLAKQIHIHDWRLKPLHRLIVTSQTYQQSSTYDQRSAQVDADARYLWRYPPRRLSAEEIRDTMLSVAGTLDGRMGGPGFRLYRYIQDNVATYIPLDKHGPETFRRAVYHQNARASRVDLMTEFDCPDNALAAPRRAETTTPLQALTMLNHQFSLDMSEDLACRLVQEAEDGQIREQVRLGFRLAYSRAPTDVELEDAVGLVEAHGLRAFCRALLNSNELIYLE